MTTEDFDKIVDARIQAIYNTLNIKAKEYRRNDNPLHNFDRAASLSGLTREEALLGFALKHYTSFMDMIDDIKAGNLPTEYMVNEKLGDLINYMILMEACIKDRIQNDNKGSNN